MSGRSPVARLVRCAAAAAALAVLASSLHGEPQARVAPVRPATPAPKREPNARGSLQDFARSIGFEHTWITPDRTLRLKSRLNEIVLEIDRREAKVNGLRVFLGDGVTAGKKTLQISDIDRDRLLLPIIAPQKLPPMRPLRLIALDAGHGGRDRGTYSEAFKLEEKVLTLEMARRVKALLEARGLAVFMTRTDDSYIALPDRAKRAADAGADIFVSIHFNAAGPTVRGIETYVLTPQFQRSTGSDEFAASDDVRSPGNLHDGWNAHLGYVMHRQLVRDLVLPDRGLKHARFVVLRDLGACPGVLIECGYLSHKDEARLINDAAHREKIAATVATGLVAFNQRLIDLGAARTRRPTGAK